MFTSDCPQIPAPAGSSFLRRVPCGPGVAGAVARLGDRRVRHAALPYISRSRWSRSPARWSVWGRGTYRFAPIARGLSAYLVARDAVEFAMEFAVGSHEAYAAHREGMMSCGVRGCGGSGTTGTRCSRKVVRASDDKDTEEGGVEREREGELRAGPADPRIRGGGKDDVGTGKRGGMG